MNNNHALTASNLLSSLPQVLQDDASMVALASSIATVLEKRKDEIRSVAIYPRIDELPGDLLDILAKDFKVDWWDKSYSLETKRDILKTCWHTHRILGTKEAVTTALRALYDRFEIKEWWEYDGEPGCFKVETRTHEILGELAMFLEMLGKVKRLSAHLEKIEIRGEKVIRLYIGFAIQIKQRIAVDCEIPPDLDAVYLTDENGELLVSESGAIIVL